MLTFLALPGAKAAGPSDGGAVENDADGDGRVDGEENTGGGILDLLLVSGELKRKIVLGGDIGRISAKVHRSFWAIATARHAPPPLCTAPCTLRPRSQGEARTPPQGHHRTQATVSARTGAATMSCRLKRAWQIRRKGAGCVSSSNKSAWAHNLCCVLDASATPTPYKHGDPLDWTAEIRLG